MDKEAGKIACGQNDLDWVTKALWRPSTVVTPTTSVLSEVTRWVQTVPDIRKENTGVGERDLSLLTAQKTESVQSELWLGRARNRADAKSGLFNEMRR